tara:strand:+ start:200137 stop:202911 length:2775 start_codon:yes stop_codon:yes gene_type:complete
MMEKTYEPHSLEKKWYQHWEESGYFAPQPNEKAYCIMLPPPNVTGSLHMGHAFQDTLMDALIRYHRMRGYQTLWQSGADHAGIATQMVVERQLAAQNQFKHDLGREAFIDKIWEWKEESGGKISQQMRRLGASVDWSRECFTLDEERSEAVREAFVRLFDEGLIYKGKRLVNWDPKLHTAVSDLEVVSEEEDGFLWYMRYPLANNDKKHMIVATTRPETMLGDVAVAVHPDDERYKHLIGENLKLPLSDRLINIIADDTVLPEFGTGCVKITPAHDFNDHEMGKRHGLAMINIFDDSAKVNRNAPVAYQGLDRFAARKRIVEDLEKLNLLEKIEPYKVKIPRGDRSGEVLEPYLTAQWFVKAKPLAAQAIEVVQNGKVKFVPENWQNTYYEWMNNIQDWCISRQLWWGHRIPAWYDDSGNIYVGHNEEEVRNKYSLGTANLKQDEDVLDTWFSSALWPFSTLGWPHDTAELAKYYPTNVLVTGFDIIFFWVARMIMMGLKFTDKVPFHTVFVHGLIQDSHGQKMSKSKGNILDPIDLIDGIDLESLLQKRTYGLMQPKMKTKIEKATRKEFPDGIPSFGTDALRITFAALATNGRHIRFELPRVEGYRNFCNKIWNASRFVLMNVENHSLGESDKDRELSVYDQWILSIWQKTKQQVSKHFDEYRFDLVVHALYEFTWDQYCDWYLEFTKPILTHSENEKLKQGTRYTLVKVLDELLRVFHPIIPYITEEIWQKTNTLLNTGQSENQTIMQQKYPVVESKLLDDASESTIAWIKVFVTNVRTIRAEMNIKPSQPLPVVCVGGNTEDKAIISAYENNLKQLAKVSEIHCIESKEDAPVSAASIVGEMAQLIPLKGLIDKEQESARLEKEMNKLKKDIAQFNNKLQNEAYIKRAPTEIVETERNRLSIAEAKLAKLNEHYEKIAAL